MTFKRKSDFLMVASIYGVGLVLFFTSGSVVRFREPVTPLTMEELSRAAAQQDTEEPGETLPEWRLLSTPSRAERIAHFSPQHAGWGRFRVRWTIARIRLLEGDSIGPLSNVPLLDPHSLRGTLAGAYLSTGDFASARAVLRKAIRGQELGPGRSYLCGELAWLEDDPVIATTLLEQSLAHGPGTVDNNRWPFLNALELAMTTDNPELAAAYWARFPGARDVSIQGFPRNSRSLRSWIKLRRLKFLVEEATSNRTPEATSGHITDHQVGEVGVMSAKEYTS